jgi:hypothetical protein
MLDVVTEINHDEDTNSLMENAEGTDNEEIQNLRTNNGKQALKMEINRYYDKQQQLKLVLVARELSKFGDHELSHTKSDEKETCGMDIQGALTSKRTQLV